MQGPGSDLYLMEGWSRQLGEYPVIGLGDYLQDRLLELQVVRPVLNTKTARDTDFPAVVGKVVQR